MEESACEIYGLMVALKFIETDSVIQRKVIGQPQTSKERLFLTEIFPHH